MRESWLTRALGHALFKAATQAASVLNTQPWLFDVNGERIDVYGDTRRLLTASDPEGRQLVMSCGGALLNLRVAMIASGWQAIVEKPATLGADMHIARIRLGQARAPNAEMVNLFNAIPNRRTNRRPFSPERPKSVHLQQLVHAAVAEGAKAVVLDGDKALDVADIVKTANRELWVDAALRAEIGRWVHSDPDRGDGIPVEALGPVPRTDRAMVRDFGFGAFPDVRTDSEFEDSPVLVLLSTPGDHTDDWISAGQALQRLQLTATHVGLATSLLGQPLETGLRDALRHATLTPGTPQMLLRVGYAPGSPPTPRRNLEQVLRHDPWSVGRSADWTAGVPPARHHW